MKSSLIYLKSIIGSAITEAIQELYFFDGRLDNELMGMLKITLANNREFTFSCADDADSLVIREGGFSNKSAFEKDFDNNLFQWTEQSFISSNRLNSFGVVTKCYTELLSSGNKMILSGCRIVFESQDYLSVWTTESDNIFYSVNTEPPYYQKNELKIKLIDVI